MSGQPSLTDDFVQVVGTMQLLVFHDNRQKGFWEVPRNDGEMIALMHSELSEALEGLRHGNPPSNHIPKFSAVEEELADCVIRIMDYCGGRKLLLAEAILAKLEFNRGRVRKHGKEF